MNGGRGQFVGKLRKEGQTPKEALKILNDVLDNGGNAKTAWRYAQKRKRPDDDGLSHFSSPGPRIAY